MLPEIYLPIVANIGHGELSAFPSTRIGVDSWIFPISFQRTLSQQIRTVLGSFQGILTTSAACSLRRLLLRVHTLFEVVPYGGSILLPSSDQYGWDFRPHFRPAPLGGTWGIDSVWKITVDYSRCRSHDSESEAWRCLVDDRVILPCHPSWKVSERALSHEREFQVRRLRCRGEHVSNTSSGLASAGWLCRTRGPRQLCHELFTTRDAHFRFVIQGQRRESDGR